jgi:hypothetical protein
MNQPSRNPGYACLSSLPPSTWHSSSFLTEWGEIETRPSCLALPSRRFYEPFLPFHEILGKGREGWDPGKDQSYCRIFCLSRCRILGTNRERRELIHHALRNQLHLDLRHCLVINGDNAICCSRCTFCSLCTFNTQIRDPGDTERSRLPFTLASQDSLHLTPPPGLT